MSTQVYAITCLENGNKYVGETKKIFRRFNQHRYMLRRNKHVNTALQEAWNKFGEERFAFEIFELNIEINPNGDAEQQIQDYLRNRGEKLFNKRINVKTNEGISYPDEAKAKMSTKAKQRFSTKEARIEYGKIYCKNKPYQIRSPEGEIFEFYNLNEFCRDHDLLPSCLGQLVKGNCMSHRDWTNVNLPREEMKVKRLTEKEKESAVTRYQAGESGAQIAESLGVAQSGINKLLNRRGVEMRPPGGRRKIKENI